MKISFTLGAGQDVRINQVASRVLTENLIRNDNFDVNFLNFPIVASYKTFKDIPKYMEMIKSVDENLYLCPSAWFNMLKVTLGHYKYSHLLLDELKTDYLFYSCSLTMLEFKTVADILNRGVKLVIGGPLLNSFTFKEVRQILAKKVKPKFMQNLLIIKGYVDLTTDLYEIVSNWKDHKIVDNDFSTFWDCTEDYVVNNIRTFKKFFDTSFLEESYPFKYSVFILDNYCWWSKCRFCLYPFFDKIDYTGGLSAEKLADNIIQTWKKQGNEGVFFANDYFVFRDKYKKLMKILVDNGIKICVFTGVKSLQNKEFIENVNKYVSALKLGIENFTDFTLNYINKGYTYDDIKDMSSMVRTHMKKDVSFLSNVIIDLPVSSRREIITNYKRAQKFKEEMISAGFDFRYSYKMLVINRETKEQFIDNKFVSVNDSETNISGRHLLFKYFRDLDIITDDFYKEMAIPMLRKTNSGKTIPSDLNVLSKNLSKEIFKWN